MIRVNFAGASLVKPGSYTDTQVAQGSLASPALGVVALIGESDEGLPFAQETGLSAVTYGPDEFAAIVDKFGSGELVDAAKLAISPSNDPQIRGGAQELILIKTNASTIAQMAIPQGAGTYGTLSAKRAGSPGNNISYACSIVSSGPDTGRAIITLSRLDTGVKEISAPLGLNPVLTVRCTDGTATAATITITETTISTTITGGTTASLSLDKDRFATIKQFADFLNTQPGYTATIASAALGAKSPDILDQVTAASILSASLVIKKDAFEVRDFFAQSSLATFSQAIASGLPTVKPQTHFTGGAKGATSAANVTDAIDALLKRRVNFIVPLFSRDAAADIADNLTDPASTYDIHATHTALAAHCNLAASVKGRKERQGWVGFKDTFANTAEASAAISSARVAMCFQDVDVVSASTGLLTLKQPHMLAVLAASMKASAAVGLPNTFKSPSIGGFAHTEFDAETQADKALEANLCFVEKAPSGGFRFVLDNSTYSSDTNAWIYNRPSVLYAADTAAYAIRINTEQFIGQRNSDVTDQSITNLLVGVMDQLKSAGIIVADANSKFKGYKDLNVKIKGSIVEIDVTLVLVEGLEFILSTIKVQRAG